MPSAPPSRFRGRCRVYFRRCRLALWLVILLVLGAVLYLNQAGLPGFLKRPLLDKLRARGVDLQFSRIHLSMARGIVAENVVFGPAGDPLGVQITFAQLVVGLNYHALLRRQLQIDSLALRRGRLAWPIAETNDTPRRLVLDNVQTDLRFLPDDEWALDNFRATFADARLQLAGRVTHASSVRDWSWFQAAPGAPTSNPWPNRLREVADTLQRLQFQTPPELRLDVNGDARDPWSFSARLFVNAPDAQTPWGTMAGGRFITRLFPATNNQMSRAELSLTAATAQTRWASLTNFSLHLNLSSLEGWTNVPAGDITLQAKDAHTPWASGTNIDLRASFMPLRDRLDALQSRLRLSMQHGQSRWGEASNVQFTGQGVYSLTNPLPLSASGRLVGEQARTPWGRARLTVLSARFALGAIPAGPVGEIVGAGTTVPAPWYRPIESCDLDWDCRLTDFASPDLAGEELASQGNWRMPWLTITNLHARFGEGRVDLRGKWDVVAGSVAATLRSDAEPALSFPVLPEQARAWLKEVAWLAPPRIEAEISLQLPSWTNPPANWFALVEPSLNLRGTASLPQGVNIKGISVRSAQTGFAISNQCWALSDLVLTRPEGQFTGRHEGDLRSKTFHSRVASSIDPRALLPVLPPDVREAFNLLTLAQPPVIDAEVWGSLDHLDQFGFRGQVRLTNFAFRGEAATSLQTGFQFTNRYLECFAPQVRLGAQQLMADGLAADFVSQRIFLTNGFSTAEPMVVARAIGPQIGRTLAPYQFHDPPTVHGHGTIPMYGEEAADLYFHVEGGQFHWLYFTVPAISGDLHWAGLHLTLGDVHTDLYDGKAVGSAGFFFNKTNPGTAFAFSLNTTNTDLKKLMAAVSDHTNHLEGRLSGTLVITNANSDDWRQTGGYGNVRLQDGLIWDIPLFGILSKPLDNIAPGMGTSRVSAGDCTFFITNGVIRSDNLELHSPVAWLSYHGAIDLEGRVNARVEAEPLRDKPLVGPLFSLVLWPVTKLFEYKVTGSIDDPKTEILNPIPRLIFLPLHPLRTIKSFFPEDSGVARTNHPAGVAPR